MTSKKTYYITTPIYYPSSDLHIGHTYTTVAADAIKRFKKLTGYDAYLLTGTDEHGQKIQKAAEEQNKTPQEFVDGQVEGIKKLWDLMNIDYDQFIRTTDSDHIKTIQKIFKKLYEQGDIYKGRYEGHYCTPCESFWTDSQLVDGKCPDCGRDVITASEEAYFFKMSKYADRLIDYINNHPDFILPESRKNEMINNFLKPGLQDLCVSRTSFDWGVPVDFDPGHVVYVWMDALPNYISALGYLNDKEDLMKNYWPADVHLVGKDIIRFHTIYWPIFLMALGLELPKKVYGHGWILIQGGKISKSIGNVIDPVELAEKYGVDALRYHILSEMKAGSDGNYSEEILVKKINSDLANDLGNLISRTAAMTAKYFDGTIPNQREAGEFDQDLIELAESLPEKVETAVNNIDLSKALEEIFKLVSQANKYIDQTEPWVLGKNDTKKERLAAVLYNLTEAIRYIGILLAPFMPETGEEILNQFLVPKELRSIESLKSFGQYPEDLKIQRHKPLFPRIELKEERKQPKKEEPKQKTVKEIGIDDFEKLDIKVGKILESKKHPNADRLLVSKIDTGDKVRQIVSGIAKDYRPEELVGKEVIVLTNLKPVKLRGEISEGMILAAEDKNGLSILTTDKNLNPGSKVR